VISGIQFVFSATVADKFWLVVFLSLAYICMYIYIYIYVSSVISAPFWQSRHEFWPKVKVMFPLFGWVGSQQISKNRILTNIVLGKMAGLTYLSTTSWILLVVEWRLASENLAEPGPSGPNAALAAPTLALAGHMSFCKVQMHSRLM